MRLPERGRICNPLSRAVSSRVHNGVWSIVIMPHPSHFRGDWVVIC